MKTRTKTNITFQGFEMINDISNVNQIKKQNSFFSLDTDISSILNPKKNESQEKNKFNFTLDKTIQNQEQKEENTNGFCFDDKERFFKNNKREIKNMIKLYNKERMEKRKIINLRNDINNTEINEVKNTATFFYFNNKKEKEKKEQKIYQKRIPTLTSSYQKEIKKKSFFKGIKTKVYNLPETLITKTNLNNNRSHKREKKNTLSLVTDDNIIFNNGKKRIISFKANRRLYKNKSFEKINHPNINNKEKSNNINNKEPKYLVINPILSKNSNTINNKENDIAKNDKYRIKRRHIEEIDIDLSNYNNSYLWINNNNYNTQKYIYKKNLTKTNKINNNFNTQLNGK